MILDRMYFGDRLTCVLRLGEYEVWREGLERVLRKLWGFAMALFIVLIVAVGSL